MLHHQDPDKTKENLISIKEKEFDKK